MITNSNTCPVYLSNSPIDNVDLHHHPFSISYSSFYRCVNNLYHRETMYNWNKANYKFINLKLGAINWNSIIQSDDTNSMMCLFYSNICSIVNDFILKIDSYSNFPKSV